MKSRYFLVLLLTSAILFFALTSGWSLTSSTLANELHVLPETISEEHCEWEAFSPTCPPSHVVYVTRANYGRMRTGRCITSEFGQMGCFVDVIREIAGTCSGRRSCHLRVIDLHDFVACPRDFKSYLEVAYVCLEVITSKTGCPSGSSSSSSSSPSSSSSSSSPYHYRPEVSSPAPGHTLFSLRSLMSAGSPPQRTTNNNAMLGRSIEHDVTSGFLSSSVAMETGNGAGRCPWIFKLHTPHQKLNLTLHQFSDHYPLSLATLTEVKTTVDGGIEHHSTENDSFDVRDPSKVKVTTIVSGQPFNYVTEAGTLEVELAFVDLRDNFSSLLDAIAAAATSEHHRLRHHHHHHRRHSRREGHESFQVGPSHPGQEVVLLPVVLIQFKVVGCGPLVAPSNTWSYTDGHVTTVTCNDTGEYFRLTCTGIEWSGRIGNCSTILVPKPSNVLDWSSDRAIQQGLMFVVFLGLLIGVATGFLMLIAVLAYMKRRKQRRIRSRSLHALNSIRCDDCATDSGHFDLHEERRGHHLLHDLPLPPPPHLQPEAEDEAKTETYKGGFLSNDGNADGFYSRGVGNEFDNRNWVWSTWIRRPDVYAFNARNSGMRGEVKASSTMTMIFRKMAGKMRGEKAFSNAISRYSYDATNLDANEVDVATAAAAAAARETPTTARQLQYAVSSNHNCKNVDDDLELNRGTPSSIDFNASDIEEETDSKETNNAPTKNYEVTNRRNTLKRCYSSRTSKEKKFRSSDRDPYYFKLDTCSGLAGVKATRKTTRAQQQVPTTTQEYSKIFSNESNCNSADVLRQQDSQQSMLQQQGLQQNILQQRNGENQTSGNVVAVGGQEGVTSAVPQYQRVGPGGSRDNPYGVCFTSDLPHSTLVDVMTSAYRRLPALPLQPFQHQPLCNHHHHHHRHKHRHHHQQTRLYHFHNGFHQHSHLQCQYRCNFCNNNNNNKGDDDDDDDDVIATNRLEQGEEKRHCFLHSPYRHHHHHNHNHRSRHHRGDRHHHNFILEKPDLVTQTPPPLPVKCLTPNRCPACSRGNLSAATSPSAIL